MTGSGVKKRYVNFIKSEAMKYPLNRSIVASSIIL